MWAARLARVTLACALAGALLVPAVAAAQDDDSLDEEGHALFESANLAFQSGRYEVALQRFREALELTGREELNFNIGLAAVHLNRNAEALEAFRRYVAQVPDAPNRADAEARIRILEDMVAREQAAQEQEQEQQQEQETEPPPDQTVPPPDEAARSGTEDGATGPLSDTGTSDEGDHKPVTSRWWFWTVIGAVVVGGVALTLALTLGGGGVQGPLPGSNGASYQTLLEAP